MSTEIKKINRMKWVGIILFVVGLIICIGSGSKMPDNGETYPDTLNTFIIFAVFSTIGIVIWHIKQKALVAISNKNHNKIAAEEAPVALLEKTHSSIFELESKIDNYTIEEITEHIEVVLDKYILPFAEVRQKIINLLGFSKAANVLDIVAYGERYLNRAHSAAIDDNLSEIKKVLPEVILAFSEASKILEENLLKIK
jgi:hypothetical protein